MFPRFGRVLACTALLATAGLAQAGPYTSLVVFGDSLSDSGNNAAQGLFDKDQVVTGNTYVPRDTYAPAKTYSNGPVWASYAASTLGLSAKASFLGGTNFAMGGATTGTPGVGAGGYPFPVTAALPQLSQLALYAFTNPTPASASTALFVVAAGGNNARAALDLASAPGANVMQILGAAADAFAADSLATVQALKGMGAQHIVVWNAPNLGLAPAVMAAGPLAAGLGTTLASMMNTELSNDLAGMSGVEIYDLFGFGGKVATMSAAFGFTNTTDACGAVVGANCSQYAYWDGIHPTTAAHRALAGSMLMSMGIPEPGALALAALALVAMGASRARSRRA